MPPPGKVDRKLDEFWEGDPWRISSQHNLSGYERNRVYLNVAGQNFLDMSYLTSADSDGDARCAVAADLNGDGRNELIVRQVSGGALLVFENNFPQRHWLRVSLRGVKSNRLGIGARLTASVGDRQIVRHLFPVNSYRSQAPSLVHFGLDNAEVVDSLAIRWPSGVEQTLKEVASDQHIVVREGQDVPHLVTAGVVFP